MMSWGQFLTIVGQTVISLALLAVIVAFVVAIVGVVKRK